MSQTTGALRLRWDPFIRHQRLLDGATAPAAGVRVETVSRHRLRMVSEYTSVRAPHQVGMRMVDGPWFFERFGGGWSFVELDDDHTRATWRYTFTVKPSWIAPVADPIGIRLLSRDIEARIGAFAAACGDEDIAAAALTS